jgi:hypothetical protein
LEDVVVTLKDARNVIAAADFKIGHPWLLKQNLIGVGGLRAYIRIAPVSGAFKNCKLRPQQEPTLRPFFWKKDSPVGVGSVGLAS